MMSRPDTKNGRTPRVGARRRAHLFLWAFLLFPMKVRAGDVSVRIDPQPKATRVEGEFHTSVSPELVWEVVSDYDHIHDFVHSMVASRSTLDSLGVRRVEQTAAGGLFVFHRRVNVLLELDEERGRRIRFHDVLGKDFRRYNGEWLIESDSTGTRVRYALDADPRAPLPRTLFRGMLKDAAEDLLGEVRTEILRRAAALEAAREAGTR